MAGDVIIVAFSLRPFFRASSDLPAFDEMESDLLCANEILRRCSTTLAIVSSEGKHGRKGVIKPGGKQEEKNV